MSRPTHKQVSTQQIPEDRYPVGRKTVLGERRGYTSGAEDNGST